MEHLIKVTFIGLLSGMLGTGIGGAAAFFVRNSSKRFLSFTIEFSAGLMTSVVCFKLLPEAFEQGGAGITFAGIFAGIVTIMVLEAYIKNNSIFNKSYTDSNLLKAGILTSVGIALHNLPEGFAVGSGFEASLDLGIALTAVMIIHDIPEGIAMAVPMRAGGFSRTKAFLLTLASGLPMGIGAFFGAALGGISIKFTAVCLGFAAGAMLYVVYGELVPESKRLYFGRLSSMGNILGIIIGIIVSLYG